MHRPPLLAAAAIVLAALGWALSLTFGDGPLSESAAALLAADLLLVATVVAVGVVWSRGRWTRRMAALLVVVGAAIGVPQKADGWWIGAVAATGLAVLAVAGPWLGRWLRKSPRSDGPPSRSVALLLGLLLLPGLVAATAPGGVALAGWLLAGFAAPAAWLYARARTPALWAIRALLPLLGLAAAVTLGWAGGLVLGTGVVTLTALAWSREALAAAMPPVTAQAGVVPIPPELTPTEVLEAAGLDDRGRRREGSGK